LRSLNECKLLEYSLDGELRPVKYLQYLVRHRFANPLIDELVGSTFLIDVVRKDFLVEYLEILEKEFDVIKRKLVSWTE